MKTNTHIGIWMDHAHANVMDANNDPIVTNVIKSEFTHEEKERTLTKGEHMMHNEEQQKQHAYYKKLGDVLKNYEKVLLFGPTSAKEELHNFLKKDRHFEKIKIEVKHADKMTENQQHAFVKDYFRHVLK